MSQIRYRTFTEHGSSRVPPPFNPRQDAQHDAAAQSKAGLTDRKQAGERDDIAASVVLGYN